MSILNNAGQVSIRSQAASSQGPFADGGEEPSNLGYRMLFLPGYIVFLLLLGSSPSVAS